MSEAQVVEEEKIAMKILGVPTLLRSSQEDEELGRENIASNVIQLVGWTPLVELKEIMKRDGVDARLIGKIEYYQPLSSVKDRAALRIIENGEEKGLITPGVTTLIFPTSGNFGIGVVFIAIRKGYKCIAVMPDGYSFEKQVIMKYLGADIVLSDLNLGFKGLVDKVDELSVSIPDSYVIDQFSNPANADAHFTGTGPEIWRDTAGKVDILVSGVGSGGTLSGTGRYLKMKNPDLKVIAVEPAESPVISGGKPGKHNIQGIGAGVIPDILDVSLIDEVITVTTEEALSNARRLAVEEGLLAGISSGAALAASLKAAKKDENKGKMIVAIFPSGGERYLSTELFAKAREECMKMTC